MSIGKKVYFGVVIMDFARRGALPEEASICTAEMTAINKNSIEKKQKIGNIYRHSKLYAVH